MYYLRVGLLQNIWSDVTIPFIQKLFWVVREEDMFTLCFFGLFFAQLTKVEE